MIFPVHPRTAKNLKNFPNLPENIYLVDPQSYFEFNWLVKNSLAIITDSGGVTEEATVLNIPCLTLRNTTERPETVEMGTNVLVGSSPANLEKGINQIFEGRWKKGSVPPLWDGNTALRIVRILENIYSC